MCRLLLFRSCYTANIRNVCLRPFLCQTRIYTNSSVCGFWQMRIYIYIIELNVLWFVTTICVKTSNTLDWQPLFYSGIKIDSNFLI